MKTIVVTGITGKSGQFFLKKMLLHAKELEEYRFKFVCRRKTGVAFLDEAADSRVLNVQICELDLKNRDAVRQLFEEPADMLIHIASVLLTMDIVPIALKSGVDNIIMVHTTGIYSKYKAAGEEYRKIETKIEGLVQDYRAKGRVISTTILRPTMVYGDLNDQNIATFIKMVDKLRVFPTVNGARYDLQPVWCKDLGDAYYEVMTRWEITRNKEYILSGGAPIQLREMFQVIAYQLGVKNTYVSCPFVVAYIGSWMIYILSLKKIDFREKVQRLVEPRAYGHELATKDFGYCPAEFAVGVRDEIEMYKKVR